MTSHADSVAYLQMKVPIVDAERAVKEKVGVKETNLAKEAALLKEANIERGLVVGAAVKKGTQTGKLIPTPDPVNMNVRVKKDPPPKAVESFKRLDAVEKVVVKEKITVSACPCSRALKLIMCAECGVTFTGRLQVECKAHPRWQVYPMILHQNQLYWFNLPYIFLSGLLLLSQGALPAGRVCLHILQTERPL